MSTAGGELTAPSSSTAPGFSVILLGVASRVLTGLLPWFRRSSCAGREKREVVSAGVSVK
jgi:hypothetical protein